MIFNRIWNFVNLKYKCVRTGDNLSIKGRVHIHGEKGGISIGKNCLINSSHDANYVSGFSVTHLCANSKNALIIGDNVGLSNCQIIAVQKIIIEDNVLVGSGVKIWDTDFHALQPDDRKNNCSAASKPVTVKKNAFIGSCAIILKGVTIGENAVIGAGSVVTKDVPNGEVWAGNPARMLRGAQ